MHILFLADHLGYRGGAWHGRTTYFVNVLPQLLRAGHRVSACFLRAHHPAAQRLQEAGIDVRFFDVRPGSPYSALRLAARLLRADVDVLHVTQRESTTIARMLIPFMRSTATVAHFVDSDPLTPLEKWLNPKLPQPDIGLCVSRSVIARATDEYNINPQRLRVLHNAVDLAALRPSAADIRQRLRKQWNIAADALVVTSTSRFGPEKRLDVLIRMIPQVLREVPQAVFVLAGAGSELEPCRELALRLGVSDAVRFLGHRDDVRDVLAASDVAVTLCLVEAFGFAVVEALALGCPVIGYNAAGPAEIIVDGRSGLLAPADQDSQFCANLIRVLRDTDLRRQLSEGAREGVKRFAIGVHVEALERIYEEFLMERGRVFQTRT